MSKKQSLLRLRNRLLSCHYQVLSLFINRFKPNLGSSGASENFNPTSDEKLYQSRVIYGHRFSLLQTRDPRTARQINFSMAAWNTIFLRKITTWKWLIVSNWVQNGPTQGSKHRLVHGQLVQNFCGFIGPGTAQFSFKNGSGAVRSWNVKFGLVRVRCGPQISIFFWCVDPWSD